MAGLASLAGAMSGCCPPLGEQNLANPLSLASNVPDPLAAQIAWRVTSSTCPGSTTLNGPVLSMIFADATLNSAADRSHVDCAFEAAITFPGGVYARSVSLGVRGVATIPQASTVQARAQLDAPCSGETRHLIDVQEQQHAKPDGEGDEPWPSDMEVHGASLFTASADEQCNKKRVTLAFAGRASLAFSRTGDQDVLAGIDSLDLAVDFAACSGPRVEQFCAWNRDQLQRIHNLEQTNGVTREDALYVARFIGEEWTSKADPECRVAAHTNHIRAAALSALEAKRDALLPFYQARCKDPQPTNPHDLSTIAGDREERCRVAQAMKALHTPSDCTCK